MKIKKTAKKIITIILIILFIVLSAGVFYLLFLRDEAKDIWYSESWSYRKAIFLELPKNLPNIEHEILVEVDTQTLISEGKLENNCRDLRFVDEDNSSILKYWIEGGCNESNTQIWIRTRIPRASDKVIYMYYGNELAPDGQEEWRGEFVTISLDECEKVWKLNSDFEGKFPLGSTVYGNSGGSEAHSHELLSSSEEADCSDTVLVAKTVGEKTCDYNRDNIANNLLTQSSSIPEHSNVNFCSSRNGYLSKSSIINSEDNTPDGWQHISLLDNKSPRGNNNEEEEVTENHVHTTSCTNYDLSFISGEERYLTVNNNTDTEAASVEIPYYTLNFISNENGGPIPSESILMVTSIPPMGWDSYKGLEDRIVKGSTSNSKETGGVDKHQHKISTELTVKNTTAEKLVDLEMEKVCLPNNSERGIETVNAQNLPPYISVIYAKKKSGNIYTTQAEVESNDSSSRNIETERREAEDKIGITIDEEKTKEEIQKDDGDVLGATAPTAPTDLLTEGQINPTDLSTPNPKFSAIYNDTDVGDTSSYYEIEVNTLSNFTGTVMWDSSKASMTTTNKGTRSPDITYAGDTLSETTIYYWRIRFWDSDDNVSPWSSTANFTLISIPTATSLLTCGNNNPDFITENLTFSAIYTDPGDTNSTNYEIEVNTASDFTGTVMWDSGKTPTNIPSGRRSNDIPYAGTALTHDNTTYYVRLRFWDGEDVASTWVTGQFTDILKGFRLDGFNIDGINLD